MASLRALRHGKPVFIACSSLRLRRYISVYFLRFFFFFVTYIMLINLFIVTQQAPVRSV